jgi:hypothetical protein
MPHPAVNTQQAWLGLIGSQQGHSRTLLFCTTRRMVQNDIWTPSRYVCMYVCMYVEYISAVSAWTLTTPGYL